jgi:hypothetical protein
MRVLPADTLTGDKVRNTDGEDIGTITMFSMDILPTGKPHYG